MSLPNELMPVGLLGTGATGGYEIERSLRFNSVDTAYLTDDTASSGGNTTTWTLSMWVKRSSLAAAGSSHQLASAFIIPNNPGSVAIAFDENQKIVFGSYFTAWRVTTQVFRDFSAWYHFVFVWDTTNGTSNDRVRIYVNGTRITAFDTNNDPGLNAVSPFCDNQPVEYSNQNIIGKTRSIGVNAWYQLRPFDGYIADVNCVQGQALDPTSFGEFDKNGIWQPIAYDGEYGTNGFHLDFSDNSAATATTLGADSSPNGNNWAPNNFSVTAGAGNDSLIDVPTNGTQTDTGLGGEVRGNYCTLNPLDNGGATLANGNLEQTYASAAWRSVRGTIGVNSGKWYWEGIFTAGGTANADGIGFSLSTASLTSYAGDTGSWGYLQNGVTRANGGSSTSYGASYTTGDIVGIALDLNAGTCTFYKNGASQGQAFSGLSGTFFPFSDSYNNSKWVINFGQRPFAYQAPSGFKALNTANLPTPTILDGSDYMDVVTWTGNGAVRDITGLEFSPEFVWIKGRSQTSNHFLFDVVRGATNRLCSSLTNAEASEPNTLTSFNSDGFSLGTDAGVGACNISGQTYVAWTWDAGSTTVTNTAGSITSSVRANPSAGFSIVTYTYPSSGSFTVGHGLGAAPSLIITKHRTRTEGWYVYHSTLGKDYVLRLDTTGVVSNITNFWGSAAISSTTFGGTVGTSGVDGDQDVAYCFAPVAGYSAFGSYTGNGSSDGPFVYTNGFRPRWVMIKETSGLGNWLIWDTARSPSNIMDDILVPNSSGSEITDPSIYLDVVSNGFKIRSTSDDYNGNTASFVYAAFAENPFSLNVRAR